MLSEYEASVLTKFRMKGSQSPHGSLPVAGSAAAIGLALVGTLVLWSHERSLAIGAGVVSNMSAETQPAISENNSAAP